MQNIQPMVYSACEAARALKTDVSVVLERLERGEIPAYKEGRYWKVPKETLQKHIEERAMKEARERREEHESQS